MASAVNNDRGAESDEKMRRAPREAGDTKMKGKAGSATELRAREKNL